jgi:hypothetical protein
MALLAGVGAVVADMDIPEIEQEFKIGEGFTVGAALDPGSLRNLTIESAKLNLQYMRGQFTLTAGGEYDKEDGAQGSISARYGDKDTFIEANGSIDPEGNIVAGLKGAFEKGLFSAEGGVQQDFGSNEFSANARVRYGDDERNVETTAKLNPDGTVELGLGAEYARGLFSSNLSGDYNTGTEDLSLSNELRYGNDTDYLKLNSGFADDQFSSTLSGQYQLGENQTLDGSFEYKPDMTRLTLGDTRTFDGGSLRSYYQTGTEGTLSGLDLSLNPSDKLDFNLGLVDQGNDGSFDQIDAGLEFTPDEVIALTLKYGRQESGRQTADLGATFSGENHNGSVNYNYDGEQSRVSGTYSGSFGDWEATASGTYNLDTGTLEKLSARLGMTTDEYRKFAIEFAHTATADKTRDEVSLLYQTTLSSFIIQTQANYAYERAGGESTHQFGGSAVVGYQGNSSYTPYVGVAGDYDSATGESFIRPRVGVQSGDLNVFVEPTRDWGGATLGIGIRF